MQYKDLVNDFIERTLKNNQSYLGDYEVTNLINSSLGLFILPEQKLFDSISDDWIPSDLLENLKSEYKSSYSEENNLKNICRHVRNGIAHFHLKMLSGRGGKITKLIIKDSFRGQHCEITFSIELLQRFFLEFSKSVLTKGGK